jgi:GntR family transcriptional regulator, transcriptional repressor for pyruvate dehydrogenase complex
MISHAAKAGERRGRVNLMGMVSDDLRQRILGGSLKVGERLPSEAELTRQYGVSRTVVREAVAALRYDNLVEARQGSGVFVLNNQSASANNFLRTDFARISSIIEMLELRAAVEAEAAGLAAVRRSPAQEEAIIESCDDIDRLIAQGRPTSDADIAFHLAIADATNNPRFREFLELLGRNLIPRAQLQSDETDSRFQPYLQQIQVEHRRITEAISSGNEAAARDCMRVHLKSSQQRYRERLSRG